jgi:signal-transduction protein with cAMP-binding, CBS, and nucleotidyltransferase domain
MKVRDAMASPAIEISADETCQVAAAMMRDHQTGVLVVVAENEGQRTDGLITDRDLVVRCLALGVDPTSQIVGKYCDYGPATVEADEDLEKAIEIMRTAGVRRLPVTDSSHLVGMLSFDDVAVDVQRYLTSFLALASQYHMRSVT